MIALDINLVSMGKAARTAARQLTRATTDQKNTALHLIADKIRARSADLIAANEVDLDNARARGMEAALVDRLSLAGKRLESIAHDVETVIGLPDPIGETIESYTLPNGLRVSRRRTPIGVLGVIYEARPNVTIDVAALAIKSSNAAILRGGSETVYSNRALAALISEALDEAGLPSEAIQLIGDTDRRYVGELLKLNQYVDLIIPRGGQSLHQFCRDNSMIPVITGGIGVNHLYVDQSVDQDRALMVIHNAKVQRPTVCNALGAILVHEAIAAAFIPRVIDHLGASGVTFRADPKALALTADSRVQAAGEGEWDIEWLALILGIKVVKDMDDAIDHIEAHTTGHSDGILTEDQAQAAQFVNQVDSAAVFVNASTRFNDGGQLGLGAEIAVSTQKVQARGPMGLRELTSYKWIVEGDYQSRA